MSAFIKQNYEQSKINNQLVNERERNDTVLSKPLSKSTFKKSFEHGLTFDSGKLIPIISQEVFPGDIYTIDAKSLIRLSATSSQPFANINFDINFFFVPYEQIDKEFVYCMGENDKKGAISSYQPFPCLAFGPGAISDLRYTEHDVANYLGVPLNVQLATSLDQLCIYEFLAYGKIWNDWYRDENLQDSIDITSYYDLYNRRITKQPDSITLKYFYTSIIYGKGLAPVSKLPNYFTTTLPYRQKGAPVKIGSSTDLILKSLPVVNTMDLPGNVEIGNYFTPKWYNGSSAQHEAALKGSLAVSTPASTYVPGGTYSDNANQGYARSVALSLSTKEINNPFKSGEIGTDISQLRDALVAQHTLETFALCGSRYVEQLNSIWGISIDPKEINRVELIGGFNDNLIFNTVQQTSETTSTQQLGKLASNLYNSVNCPRIEYAATQHGIIMGVLCARTPINNGGQGIPRKFLYKDALDMWQPLLNGISEQPIYNCELKLVEGRKDENMQTFGFNEPWLHLKYNIDRASGFMSLNSNVSLFSLFLYGEKYTSTQYLSDKFMQYDPNIIGNTLYKVNSGNKEFYQQFASYFYFDISYTTAQPLYNSPGIDYV